MPERGWTTITAGLLLRGETRRALNTAAFDAMNRNPDLHVVVTEDKGWLESVFRITAKGPAAVAFINGLNRWAAAA